MAGMFAVIFAVLRAGLRPPASLLGLAGLLLVAAVIAVPALSDFARAWHIPLLITLAAWLVLAATQVDRGELRRAAFRQAAHDPYVRRALERRDALEAELSHLTVASLRGDITAMIRTIDREMLPELSARVLRYRALTQQMEQFQRGQGPLVGASPESIALLRDQASQQRKALDGLLTRLSDMNAHLLGLNQEDDHEELARRAHGWADELGAYWQATAEVFRADDGSGGDPTEGRRGGRTR